MNPLVHLSQTLAVFAAALTIGWTGCLSFAVAPMALRELDPGRGERFVRNTIKEGHGYLALLALFAAGLGLIAGAYGGAALMAVAAFLYLMARYALAPRTDTRPAGARRKNKPARVTASAVTALVIPVAFVALVMINIGL